jgi:hypothetical protein
MAAAETWRWSDAWFLAALARTDGGEGASLADVMAMADAMNHDVLNEEEVRHAVRCLGGSGLLEVEGERFHLTSAGARLRAFGQRAEHFSREPDQYLIGLRRLGSPQPSAWALPPGAVRRAYSEYSDRLRQ